MLRIMESGDERLVVFRLAGRLAGEWAPVLERCWRQAVIAKLSQSVRVDLSEVTYVDDTGKRLLAIMARAGVELVAADVLMQALVDQIAQGAMFEV